MLSKFTLPQIWSFHMVTGTRAAKRCAKCSRASLLGLGSAEISQQVVSRWIKTILARIMFVPFNPVHLSSANSYLEQENKLGHKAMEG